MGQLTKKRIEMARYEGDGTSQDVRWDGTVGGFGVRIFPSGAKSFVLKYRTAAGHRRQATLGRVGVMTLEQARARAKEDLVAIAAGVDPLERKAEARARAVTFKAFAGRYLEEHAKPHRRSWREDKRRIDTHLVPALGRLPLGDVRRTHIQALHARIGASAAVEANRVVQLARAIFTKAMAWGELPEGSINPAEMDRAGDHGVKAFKERSRTRFVTAAELPRVLQAIEGEPNLYVRAALRLFLLTGLRRSELLRAKWADVDLERAEWTIPDTKSGEPRIAPLAPAAVELLRSLPRFAGNPHVFPGHLHGSHLTNIDGNWRAIRARAKCTDVTLHDLRRTVGSMMAIAGESLPIIGAALGHAPGDVQATVIYARLQDDVVRAAFEAQAARIAAAEVEAKKRRKGLRAI